MNKVQKWLPILSLLVFLFINILAAIQVHTSTLRSGKLLVFYLIIVAASLVLPVGLIAFAGWRKHSANLAQKIFMHRWMTLSGAVGVLAACWIFLSATADSLSNYIIVVRPAVDWLAKCAILVIASLAAWGSSQNSPSQEGKKLAVASLVALGFVGILTAFINLTGLGLERVGYYWYAPGTPILIGQVLLALLAGAGLFIFRQSKPGQIIPPARLDLWIVLLLTLTAGIAWLSEPMTGRTNFLPVPLPPNYEIYPDSDSAYLDINAQRPLIGEALSENPADKPVYSYFLSILHLLANQDYERIIDLQVITLAVIPAVFYLLLAKGFSNRPVGLAAAILFIIREKSSIALTNVILVSHPKLLLSDVPSAGLMILFAYLLVSWMRQPAWRRAWPFWLGVVFAAFVLLRSQVIVLAPLVAAWAWLGMWRNQRREMAEAGLLAVIGFAAFAIPWGIYGAGAPPSANASAYTRQLAIQFQFDPLNHQVRPLSGESETEFNARMQDQVIQFIRENPAYTLKAISAYYFRNLVQGVLYLPASTRLETDPAGYVRRIPFWDDWTGGLPGESRAIVTLNLILVAVGLASAWKRFGFAGLTPLLLYLGYTASLAIPMISGWRFLLPADWVMLLYYLLGLSEAGRWAWAALAKKTLDAQDSITPAGPLAWKTIAILVAVTLSANASLFLVRAAIPPRYPPSNQPVILEEYRTMQNLPGASELPGQSELQEFLRQDNARILVGRALYPRHFEAGEGFSRNGIISFRPYEFPRLGFYLAGPQNDNIIMPLNRSPERFPHAADALVLGCARDVDSFHRTYTEALLIFLPEEGLVLRQPDRQTLNCLD